ncbi:Cytoplasmic tRNA 2-thiolation protein 2 [Mycoemilia scoparia]|uniref:Cytoplasmic tRNA 2-thiolation protein 2 n=1 Tax=Mycoemilia scoparia TaxID=417184 RepID=A0A9W7ZTV4_9FUNG|nr:Cytoplasmic tRNA 2-thiolation protein 2 [Mycoemilia scoparia]
MSMYHQHRIKGRQQKYDNVEVFHIDESSLFKDAQEAKARDLISKYGFKTITAKLEDVFQETNSDFFTNVSIDDSAIEHKNKYPTSESPEKRSNALTHLFDQIKTYTAKEDMLDSIKAYLIVHAAQQNDCSVIAVGDSATRIAVKTIGYTSQGRGFSLPLDVGVSNRWFEGINIIRPMKDMLGKEVGYFNHCMGIDTAIVPTFTTRAPQKASIDRLTESLIVGLDRDFPSTISTIGRTAGKLEVTRKAIESPQCPLCGMPSEADSIEWRKMLSVSSLGDEEAMQNTTTPLIRAMCYSCQNTMRDVKPDAGLLPSFVNERSQNKAHNSQSLLKKQIESFLID